MFLFSVIDRAASLCSAKEHCGLLSLLSPSGLWTTYILESSWVAKSAIERLCACGSVCNCIKVHMHSQSLVYILWSCLGAYTHTHTHTHTSFQLDWSFFHCWFRNSKPFSLSGGEWTGSCSKNTITARQNCCESTIAVLLLGLRPLKYTLNTVRQTQ